jgi:hypothetical protein
VIGSVEADVIEVAA